ncbi:MAG: hypothetical protein M1368_07010 [Thaumarchaeota archaeon]|nr:hypothetical protein [Nitrososphaerota archaeon]
MLSILFGLSFGILVLYANDVNALLLDVLLLTSIVFAASREDLGELKKTKSLIALIFLIAIFVISFAVSAYDQFGTDLFEILIVSDFALLIGYIAMGRLRRFRATGSIEP